VSASQLKTEVGATSNVSWKEDDRLAALDQYAILDTPREPEFDDVVRLASDIFGAPISVVNLIAAGRQWFKAEVGIGADELPLDVSICAHAILQPGIFVVPDTTQDGRFACNPLVTGEPGLRFYAGALLETPEGLPLGTICVLDTKPRPDGITDRQRLTLEVLARQVMTQLELRRSVAERDRRADRLEQEIGSRLAADRALRETDRRLNAVLDNTRMSVFLMDHRQHCAYANAAAEELTGYSFAEMEGRPLHDVVHHTKPDGSHYPLEECPIDRAFPERAQMSGEELFVHKDGSFYPVAFTASPVLNDVGKPIGTVIEARNIAEEKAASEQLTQLAAVAEQSHEFIGVADLRGKPTFVNEAGRDMVGLPNLEAALAVDLLDYFAPADRKRIAAEALPAAKGEGYWEGEVAFRRFDDGREFPVLYNIFPVRSADGEITHFATVTRDLTETKARDAALRETEERYRLASRATKDAIWDWHFATNHVLWNEALEATYGHALAEITPTGEWWIDHIHPDDRTRIDESIHAAIDGTADAWSDEYRFRRADGSYADVLDRGHVIRDTDGRAARMIGAMFDLTERRRAEAELRALNADLERKVTERALGRSRTWQLSPEIIGVLNADACFEQSNPAWETVLGWSEQELASTRFFDFIHADDIVKTEAVFEAAMERGEPALRFENRYRTRSNDYRWLSWVAVPDDGKIYCSARDITDQKEQEAALAGATADRDRAWRLSQDLLVSAEVDGTLTAVNQAWTKLLGWSEADLLGASFIEFTHPDDLERTMEAFAGIMEAPLVTPFTYRFRAADGTYRWFAWTGAFEDGRVYASGRDVTAEREQAAELAAAEEALRQSQKMEAVGQLTGGIAHDFNNMLAVVIGSLELLKRRLGEGDPRATRYVDAGMEGARRAATLTQRLLAFSRQQPLKPEPIDANKLVAGMSDILHHSLGGDVQLETVLAGGLWRTHADPNQLENVILNLAINARDAMQGGGRLTIETANCHLDTRYAAAHLGVPAGQYVMVAVSDTCSGMPPEVIAKAFDPFFTTKGVGKGTGLGLSQVYGYVKQSGGHVKIYSEPGQGSTIKVYLPRLLGDYPEIDSIETGADLPRGEDRELILVVEDEPAVRQLSMDTLTELGYRVLEADGAAAALRLLEAHPEIAMMFTDVVMPEVNGARLAEQARLQRPDLKILFTTGYTRNAVVHNGVLDPGVELIGKPFTIEELAAKVRSVLDGPTYQPQHSPDTSPG
jgi:PAS domain S-box-containing protein